jgi:nucleotide-binding universal stress UspA family protein
MIASILVGTDGSATAGVAVARATEIAAGVGARLLIVSAFAASEVDSSPGTACDTAAAEVPLWARNPSREDVIALLAGAAEEARAVGVGEVETYARLGDAADAILDVAEEQSTDMIVVGDKGLTGATRFLLGSVPTKISHHAPCSVLIVRTG